MRRRLRRLKRPELKCAMCLGVSVLLFGDGSLRMRICASCWTQLRGTSTPPITVKSGSRKRAAINPDASHMHRSTARSEKR
jgi:hypothetical protein